MVFLSAARAWISSVACRWWWTGRALATASKVWYSVFVEYLYCISSICSVVWLSMILYMIWYEMVWC